MEIAPTIASFLTHVRVEKGLSQNTVEAYRRDLAKFESYAKKKKLVMEDVTRDDVVDFLSTLFHQKLESRTVARHMVTLRNFFRFAQAQDLIPSDLHAQSGVAQDSPLLAWVSSVGRDRTPPRTT